MKYVNLEKVIEILRGNSVQAKEIIGDDKIHRYVPLLSTENDINDLPVLDLDAKVKGIDAEIAKVDCSAEYEKEYKVILGLRKAKAILLEGGK
jgi:hypothetical protein